MTRCLEAGTEAPTQTLRWLRFLSAALAVRRRTGWERCGQRRQGVGFCGLLRRRCLESQRRRWAVLQRRAHLAHSGPRPVPARFRGGQCGLVLINVLVVDVV